MNSEALRALQAPLKARYKEDAGSAAITLRAEGRVGVERLTCRVETFQGPLQSGLHTAAGGDGESACSGDMLLEALVGCAGVTLCAVATAMSIPIRGGTVSAEGDLDFRGTLGVSKEVPVGFKAIRLRFELDTDADPEQLDNLIKLTERYCVVYQTLKNPTALETTRTVVGASRV